MFNVERNGKNRLDIAFSGKLNSSDMQIALDAMVDQSKGIENGVMLYRIGDFDLPTIGAIGVELSRLPGLFKLMGQFDKVAVIASQQWVRVVSQVEGALIPGLEIKAFESDQEAEEWLSQ